MTTQDQTHKESSAPQNTATEHKSSGGNTSMEHKFFARAKGLLTDIKTVLDKETEALKTGDLAMAVQCQDIKIKLVKEYEILLLDAKDHAAELKACDDPIKEEVKALHKQMDDSVNGNYRALKNSKKAVERITERMLEVVRQCVQGQKNMAYGATGHMNSDRRSLSINIDETL